MSESTRSPEGTAREADIEAQHAWLVNRDHNVGIEAEVGRLNRDIVLLSQENALLRRKLAAVTKRRDNLQTKVRQFRKQLGNARRRNARLTARLREMEQQPRSFPRRVAGRLRRAVR